MRGYFHSGALAVFCLAIGMVSLASCTHDYRLKIESVSGYENGDPIPISIDLVLNSEFVETTAVQRLDLDTFVYHLGGHLKENSTLMARRLFQEVQVTSVGTGIGVRNGPSLEPRVRAVSWTARRGFDTRKRGNGFLISLDWVFRDEQGREVWAQTVRGDCDPGILGGKEMVQSAINHLFERSFDAISASKEIRDYVSARP